MVSERTVLEMALTLVQQVAFKLTLWNCREYKIKLEIPLFLKYNIVCLTHLSTVLI